MQPTQETPHDFAATLTTVAAQISSLSAVLSTHIAREEEMLAAAFPAGDVVGHRKAHEAMIEAAHAQVKFWSELRLDLAKKSLWGLVMIVIGLVAVGGFVMVASKFGIASPLVVK